VQTVKENNSLGKRLREDARVIWAIAAKDIADALKNKTTLTAMLVVLFMIAFYRFMPALTGGDELTNVLVFDAGESSLVAALENSPLLDVYTGYASPAQMARYLANGDVPELGLVIPADYDRALASGRQPVLDGYVQHWVDDEEAQALKSLVEGEAAGWPGGPVRIDLEGHVVYTDKGSTGPAFTAAMSLIFATVLLGITTIPHLMIEEKKAKTMDALLVSPAGSAHVVMGKGLAGAFYGLAAVTIVLIVNGPLITHWALAVLVGICGVLFAVAVGLFLGSVVENRMQLNIWAWVLILPLLLPVFLSIMTDLLPAAAIRIMGWIPTVALSRAIRVSFAERAPLADFAPELALIVGCAALVLALVTWHVRRSDR
jgi:ABC-2 type transport system permease protein